MACVRNDQTVHACVHQRQLRSDEHVHPGEVFIHQPINSSQQLSGTVNPLDRGAEQSAQGCGEKSGGYALAHHVGDDEQYDIRRESQNIIKITTDLARA